MSNGSGPADAAHEKLSALLDGELENTAVAAACVAWREDASARSTWHAYHLIGDVLRSDDLATSPGRDSAFISALRVRLAAEPTVLAPDIAAPIEADADAAVAAPRRASSGGRSGRWNWLAPSAVAAGFVVVAGAVMVTSIPAPSPIQQGRDGSVLAQAEAPQVAAMPVVAAASAFRVANTTLEPQALVSDGRLIRDARLDRYLSAHKEFAGSTALGVPSAFLRDAVAEAPGR